MSSYQPGQFNQRPTSNSRDGIKNLKYGEACPVCGHTGGWCSRFVDSGNIICKHNPSDIPCRNDGGWIHILNDAPRPRSRPRSATIEPEVYEIPPGIEKRYETFHKNMNLDLLDLLAKHLDVSVHALGRMHVGIRWPDPHYPCGAWTWPLYAPTRKIVGIKFRDVATGKKRTATGTHAGLFIPYDLNVAGGHLTICEGASDTAAALTMGFKAIGRDGCSGLHRHVCDFIRLNRPAEILIVSDADANGKGQQGAQSLGEAIVSMGRSLKIIMPPRGYKDLRAWARTKPSIDAINEWIGTAKPIEVKFEF